MTDINGTMDIYDILFITEVDFQKDKQSTNNPQYLSHYNLRLYFEILNLPVELLINIFKYLRKV